MQNEAIQYIISIRNLHSLQLLYKPTAVSFLSGWYFSLKCIELYVTSIVNTWKYSKIK